VFTAKNADVKAIQNSIIQWKRNQVAVIYRERRG